MHTRALARLKLNFVNLLSDALPSRSAKPSTILPWRGIPQFYDRRFTVFDGTGLRTDTIFFSFSFSAQGDIGRSVMFTAAPDRPMKEVFFHRSNGIGSKERTRIPFRPIRRPYQRAKKKDFVDCSNFLFFFFSGCEYRAECGSQRASRNPHSPETRREAGRCPSSKEEESRLVLSRRSEMASSLTYMADGTRRSIPGTVGSEYAVRPPGLKNRTERFSKESISISVELHVSGSSDVRTTRERRR